MLLKKINLQNIRSYIEQEIDFPETTSMLSGDIGSGKSTILLAFEFALFGLTRGSVSGESLLRKGTNKGSVTLDFGIGNKEYVIKRGLKRVADKVNQDFGFIIENGVKTDATAVELKSKILSILNYPDDILNKKSLIFRYTVYTPQEEMKNILFEDAQSRLDTLRKVFSIDKYKRIQENSAQYTRQIRSDMRSLSTSIESLTDCQSKIKSKDDELKSKDNEINRIKPELDVFREAFTEQKQRVEALEKKIEMRRRLENSLSLCKNEIKNLSERKGIMSNDITIIEDEIKLLNEQSKIIQIKPVKKSSKDIQEHISEKDMKCQHLIKELSKLEAQASMSKNEMNNILNLDICPTCKQSVVNYHKENIKRDMSTKIISIQSSVQKIKADLNFESQSLNLFRKDLEEIRIHEENNRINNEKQKQIEIRINEKEKRKLLLITGLNDLKEKEFHLNEQKSDFEEKLIGTPLIDMHSEKELMLNKQQKVHKKEMELLSAEKEKESVESLLSQLKKQVESMLKTQENLRKIKSYHDWLEGLFIPLMTTMEKHVFSQVHSEFNIFFQEWFSMLLEDENVSVRLDDSFTPIVIQNGYEIALHDLSGGEKTSLALAYRLSLNKVINNMMTDIETKDLLILDEPTDGFSASQLDKLREVLDQLNLSQIIIVSHESKIESFVRHVIKVHKEEHVSRICV